MPKTRFRKRANVEVKDVLTETTNLTRNSRNEPKNKVKKIGSENRVPNDFGFNEEFEVLKRNAQTENTATFLRSFDPSKPYRVALYIQPLRRFWPVPKAIETSIQTSTLNGTKTANKSVKSRTKKTTKTKEVKKDGLVQRKITDMCVAKPATRPANKQITFKKLLATSMNTSSTFEDDHDLSVNAKPSRKSYEKKFKEKEPAEEDPSSEEILVELSRKKASKARTKKAKGDKALDNWAKSMNSMFDDVENFELTVLDD